MNAFATRIHSLVEERNRDVLADVTMQGLLGGFWCVVTFGAVFLLGWLLTSFWLAWLIVAVYFAVATWSALREVDPWAHLTPISRDERTRRDIERYLAAATGRGVGALRRDGIAGLAMVLIAGPRSVIGAWRSYKRILPQEQELSAAAGAILAECPQMFAPDLDARACAILARLGMIGFETDEDGDVHMTLTTRGRKLQDDVERGA